MKAQVIYSTKLWIALILSLFLCPLWIMLIFGFPWGRAGYSSGEHLFYYSFIIFSLICTILSIKELYKTIYILFKNPLFYIESTNDRICIPIVFVKSSIESCGVKEISLNSIRLIAQNVHYSWIFKNEMIRIEYEEEGELRKIVIHKNKFKSDFEYRALISDLKKKAKLETIVTRQ